MGITDIDKIYEANELASGENVIFAGSGITDGLYLMESNLKKTVLEPVAL